jgi:hypothetical protein
VGIGGIQEISLVCIGVTLEVGIAGFIIVGHGGERGFMGEFKGGGGMAGMGEVVDLSFGGFT